MSRAVSDEHGSAVSLFPFLAVLLCTMGALILLLVLLARQARLHGAPRGNAPSEPVAAIDGQRLKEVHRQLGEQFERARMRLSHLEDRIRRLRDEKAHMLLLATQLAQAEQASSAQQQRDEEERQRLQQMLEDAQRQLEARRKELQGRKPSYAVIPFEGNLPTDRRPIYIECREDAVVLQPEGVVLTAEDFRGPLGPGNPLASALRAARQYCLDHSPHATAEATAAENEPYPLVLVRPGGIVAFYKVREAIESWGPEFGYELVEDDWELRFPPPDPQLAHAEHVAIEEARLRASQLALSAPSRFASAGGYRLRAARGHAGFEAVPLADPTDLGDAQPALGPSRRKPSEMMPHDPQASIRLGPSDSADASEPTSPVGTQSPNRKGGPLPDADRLAGHKAGEFQPPGSALADGLSASDADRAMGAESGEDRSGGSRPSARGTAGGSAEGTRPTSSGSASCGPASAGNVAGGSPAGGSAAGVGSGFSPGGSMAESRGAGWADDGGSRSSVPITRPIGVEVLSDRLHVLGETGTRSTRGHDKTRTIPVEGDMRPAVDRLVVQVREQVDAWGMAGRGLHWKPVLYLRVRPGAAERAAELRRLLEGSGLELIEQGEKP